MEEKYLEYKVDGETFRVSSRQLDGAICRTDECLDAGPNMQLAILRELAESSRGPVVIIDDLTDNSLTVLDKRNYGIIDKRVVDGALKYYHDRFCNGAD